MKNYTKHAHQKLVRNGFLVLVNNPKHPFHIPNYSKNTIFGKSVIKKP